MDLAQLDPETSGYPDVEDSMSYSKFWSSLTTIKRRETNWTKVASVKAAMKLRQYCRTLV